MRCIEDRKRKGEAGETKEDWQALDWAFRYSPSPALKEHTANYHSVPPGLMGTELAHSRHSGLNASQRTLGTRVTVCPGSCPLTQETDNWLTPDHTHSHPRAGVS